MRGHKRWRGRGRGRVGGSGRRRRSKRELIFSSCHIQRQELKPCRARMELLTVIREQSSILIIWIWDTLQTYT